MDLAEFVETTLRQIVQGVQAAQGDDASTPINAAHAHAIDKGNLYSQGKLGQFTAVDFDVSVLAESAKSGKGGLTVFGVGLEGQAAGNNRHTSRISFSVPIRLPDGDQTKKEEAQKAAQERAQREAEKRNKLEAQHNRRL